MELPRPTPSVTIIRRLESFTSARIRTEVRHPYAGERGKIAARHGVQFTLIHADGAKTPNIHIDYLEAFE